jgi:hypothetical protein
LYFGFQIDTTFCFLHHIFIRLQRTLHSNTLKVTQQWVQS